MCIKLWEKIEKIKDRPPGPIKLDELVEVGDALEEYYEEVLAAVLADKDSGVAEDQVRAWFDEKLITKAGTRGFVLQTTADTGELPNSAVKLLEEKFLIRRETRAGGVWYELVHDTFIGPIRRSNQRWRLRQSVPEIERFEVHPKVISPGVEITVSWEVKNAEIVQVEPIDLTLDGPAGTARVSLEHSTALRLSAKRPGQPPVLSRTYSIVVAESAPATRVRQLSQIAEQGRLTVLLGREVDRSLLFGGADTTSQAWTTGALTDLHQTVAERYLRFVKDLLIRRAGEAADRQRLDKYLADVPDLDNATVSMVAGGLGISIPPAPRYGTRLLHYRRRCTLPAVPTRSWRRACERWARRRAAKCVAGTPAWIVLPSNLEEPASYMPTVSRLSSFICTDWMHSRTLLC